MQDDKINKWCPKCSQYILRDLFYRNAAQPDGLSPYCKACWSAHNKEAHAKKRGDKPDKRRLQMAMVRHDYFHQIDQPIQAYILGLLASDGCIHSNRPRVQFSVHEKDRVLTETVRDELAPESSILMSPCRDYKLAKVQITSPRMCEDLARLSIVPRKSHILTWPTSLPEAFINSFLLGVLDGDGWITLDQRKHSPHYIIGITSASVVFLERAAQEINATLDVPLASIGHNNTAFSIRYGGKSAVFISEWLHRDLPGLDRKRIPLEVSSLYTYTPYIPGQTI